MYRVRMRAAKNRGEMLRRQRIRRHQRRHQGSTGRACQVADAAAFALFGIFSLLRYAVIHMIGAHIHAAVMLGMFGIMRRIRRCGADVSGRAAMRVRHGAGENLHRGRQPHDVRKQDCQEAHALRIHLRDASSVR